MAVKGVLTQDGDEVPLHPHLEPDRLLPALRGALRPLQGVVQHVHQQGAQLLVLKGQGLGDQDRRAERDPRRPGPARGVLEDSVDRHMLGKAGLIRRPLLFPGGHQALHGGPVSGLGRGVQGGDLVGKLVAAAGALPQAALDGAVVLLHQLVFQRQGPGLPLGAGDRPGQLPGGEGGAHQHQPPDQPVQGAVPDARAQLGDQLREVAVQIPAPGLGDQPRQGQRPGAPGGGDPQGLPEGPLPVEDQIQRQQQGGQALQPRAGEHRLDRLRQEIGPVAHRQPEDGQQGRRSNRQEQEEAPLSVGQPQQEQPPQQHQRQGGGPGGQAVIVGVGDGSRLIRGVGGEPEERRQDRDIRQGPQVHRQRLPAPGGQGEVYLALVDRLRGLIRGGVPNLRAIQKDGDLQAGGLEDQIGAVLPVRRQGQGKAVALPLLQLRGEAGRVKGRLRPAGGHHRPRLPGGVGEGRRGLGEPLEEHQHPRAHPQKGQDG